MKYFYSLALACLSLVAYAEVITMDFNTAEDKEHNPLIYSNIYGTGYYDCTDVWEYTYNDSSTRQTIYTNDGRFMLSHLPSQASYGGMSWEGFTLSKVSQDTANVFGCIANGGIAGVGTPYAIGYFSEWVTESLGHSSNTILFDQYYYPEYVYICQNSNTMEAISYGNVFNARAFTEEDTLALIISGLDTTLHETSSVTYYLAVDGKKNLGWTKVNLKTIGRTAGLSFRMTTTDVGDFGSNTPLYFALDALTINTEQPTHLQPIYSASTAKNQMAIIGSQVVILRDNKAYNLLGQVIE